MLTFSSVFFFAQLLHINACKKGKAVYPKYCLRMTWAPADRITELKLLLAPLYSPCILLSSKFVLLKHRRRKKRKHYTALLYVIVHRSTDILLPVCHKNSEVRTSYQHMFCIMNNNKDFKIEPIAKYKLIVIVYHHLWPSCTLPSGTFTFVLVFTYLF